MYAFIWRNLPGRLGVKLLLALLMTLAAVAGLLFGVFPIVEPHLPFSHVTVDTPDPAATTPAVAPRPTPSH